MDTFTMHVEHTSGEGCFRETPKVSRLIVMADTTNDAELTALEMVASRGRCPVSVAVDWDHF